jgi:hypothetical protein
MRCIFAMVATANGFDASPANGNNFYSITDARISVIK